MGRRKKSDPQKESRKNGRPIKAIDWQQVKALATIQCTYEEIAAVVDCHLNTLHTACKRELGVSFSEIVKQYSESGKASLRRKQWKKAVTDENTTMQIWLGKNMLGQSEKQHNLNHTTVEVIDGRERFAALIGAKLDAKREGRDSSKPIPGRRSLAELPLALSREAEPTGTDG